MFYSDSATQFTSCHKLLGANALAEAEAGCGARDAVLREVLDMLESGIVLLDAHGHVVYLNAEAARLVSLHEGVCLRERRLHCRFGRCGDVRDPIRTVLDVSLPTASRTAFATVPRTATAPELVVGARRLVCASNSNYPAQVVVFITEQARAFGVRLEAITRVFGLSNKEGALAVALLQGKTLRAHAETQGITIATARTHLRSVMLKTRTCRQAELVSALWCVTSGFIGCDA